MTAAKKKKADVWMPLYVSDYLSDTMHLSAEQHGAYLLLLMAAWKSEGRLPNNPDQLQAISRLTPVKWKASESVLRAFFFVTPEYWINNRLREELEKAVKRADAGGSRARWFNALPREHRTALQAQYRSRKRQAMPKWLTALDRKKMVGFYSQAKELTARTGILHEVDHIVPLAGKTVSGLHVPWNLQVITKGENSAKSNIFWEVSW